MQVPPPLQQKCSTMKYALPALMTAFLLSATIAQAQPGRLSDETYLRSGPGTNFPIIATLTSFEDVEVSACTNQWVWCEVQTQNLKQGWIMSSYLGLPNYGPVATFGAKVGIPLIEYTQNNTGNAAYIPVAPAQVVSPNPIYAVPNSSANVTQNPITTMGVGTSPATIPVKPATVPVVKSQTTTTTTTKPALSKLGQAASDARAKINNNLTTDTPAGQ